MCKNCFIIIKITNYVEFWELWNADLLLFSQEIQLDELLTHEVLVKDIDKAFEKLKQPDCVKILIKFWLILLVITRCMLLKKDFFFFLISNKDTFETMGTCIHIYVFSTFKFLLKISPLFLNLYKHYNKGQICNIFISFFCF